MRLKVKNDIVNGPTAGTELTSEELLAIKPGINLDAMIRAGVVEPIGGSVIDRQKTEIQLLQEENAKLKADLVETNNLKAVIEQQKKAIADLEEFLSKPEEPK